MLGLAVIPGAPASSPLSSLLPAPTQPPSHNSHKAPATSEPAADSREARASGSPHSPWPGASGPPSASPPRPLTSRRGRAPRPLTLARPSRKPSRVLSVGKYSTLTTTSPDTCQCIQVSSVLSSLEDFVILILNWQELDLLCAKFVGKDSGKPQPCVVTRSFTQMRSLTSA